MRVPTSGTRLRNRISSASEPTDSVADGRAIMLGRWLRRDGSRRWRWRVGCACSSAVACASSATFGCGCAPGPLVVRAGRGIWGGAPAGRGAFAAGRN